MIKLTINNIDVEVEQGATILDAAEKINVHIPTMCFLKGYAPSTSCMVCVVQIRGRNGLVPACGAKAQDGMEVMTDTEQVLLARKRAIELLLSDHVGDCAGPCVIGCPAGMNIPLMIRQIEEGKLDEAIRTVKRDIPLPAVLGRICPAPCQKVCRRNDIDEYVSICLLKRFVGDYDLSSNNPFIPVCKESSGKSVAIIGAGPAGLSAGYYLAQAGHRCVIFDDHEKAGGQLRYGVAEEDCPGRILDAEIDLIARTGVEFRLKCRVGKDISFEQIRNDFDAVFIAAGVGGGKIEIENLEYKNENIRIDKNTYMTSIEGVFAGGDATGKRQLAIRAIADGKEAATAVDQYLTGQEVVGIKKKFNSRMGKCSPEELEVFAENVSRQIRILPDDDGDKSYPPMQAVSEAKRCLHCDCRRPDDCKLRRLAEETGAKAGKYKSQRRRFVQFREHTNIIFEPGKCINCGLCVRITSLEKEVLGLTFVARGFDVRVAVPFDEKLSKGLQVAGDKCVKACPTGAMSFVSQ